MSQAPVELVERWNLAERHLYPVVMARPDLYERYLALVRATADDLGALSSPEALAAAFGEAVARAARSAARAGVPTDGLDLSMAAGAAFALRYREVRAAAARAAAAARVQEATAKGERWVVLQEPPGERALDPFAAAVSSRVELHVPTGVAVHSFVELDPDTYQPRYGVEAARLDPVSGELARDEELLVTPRTFDDRAVWERAVAALRRECETGSPSQGHQHQVSEGDR
ncbi:MAG TPA: hypothetical protein VFA45_10700 [Actinomycetes bacterium]|jgi:hypothetical protein|nr:hypothetical protein [Actinomycetes bacterium]